tara:strand:- start:1384 stop:2232 length:849 start_codon:yes stop_codon:yes gene_type:complete
MPVSSKVSRVKQLNSITCSTKVVNFEKFLTDSNNEVPIYVPVHKTIKDITDLQVKADRLNDGEVRILGLEERTGKHSVILVKSANLPSPGWSIFDPNGIDSFPLVLTDNKIDVTSKYISVTGENINRGSDSYNPGYCGIFGIIFIIFFKANQENPDWLIKWRNFLSCLALPAGCRKCMGTLGVQLAADVINIISKISGIPSTMIADPNVITNQYTKEIYNLILETQDKLVNKSTGKCKISGGKKTHKIQKRKRIRKSKNRHKYKNGYKTKKYNNNKIMFKKN